MQSFCQEDGMTDLVQFNVALNSCCAHTITLFAICVVPQREQWSCQCASLRNEVQRDLGQFSPTFITKNK